MKVKTSITLSDNVLTAIDRKMGDFKSRSDFLEFAAKSYLAQLARTEKDKKDLEIINRRAEAINREAEDVLDFQVSL
jgi:metal-responsive CopG/Arc/MetJ family transcriptional regulator